VNTNNEEGESLINTIFNRYERKYLVTSQQKNDLMTYLRLFLVDDPYSINGNPYTIYNIYFDKSDFSVIRHSMSKPVYKDKLRLRSYKAPLENEDLVFFEIKKKYEGRINKRRLVLTYRDAMNYLEHHIRPQFESYEEQQMMSEIDFFVNSQQVKPGVFIKYNRVALIAPNNKLRITFDQEISFRTNNVNFKDINGLSVLDQEDFWLMEVKSENNFPIWLASKLSELNLYSRSYSKYGEAYQKYLLGGKNDDHIFYYH
jgi:hypothetical protein